MVDHRSYVQYVLENGTRFPDKRALTFLPSGSAATEVTRSYRQLCDEVARIGCCLMQRAGAGQRAVLLYQPGLDFVSAFLGCLYANTIAVPVYPPRNNRSIERLLSVLSDCDAGLGLTTSETYRTIEKWFTEFPPLEKLDWVVTDAEVPDQIRANEEPADPSSVAFLQYTSGSTDTPKGVMVTHANLVHNEVAIREAFHHGPDDVVVGWLPVYHDMGLIGNVLQPLFIGASCVLMAPASFIQKPARWLQAISDYKATTSGGPNFAYELCTRKIVDGELAGADLSSWTVAFCGAEPISARTMNNFAATFAEYGFRGRALYPCYGLAEATLIVTGNDHLSGVSEKRVSRTSLGNGTICAPVDDGDSYSLVSSGQAVVGTEIEVVDPVTLQPCGQAKIGEIWVSGPSVAHGYWRHVEESATTFCSLVGSEPTPARSGSPPLPKREGEESKPHPNPLLGKEREPEQPSCASGTYLRTGDLGFIDDGQLYVTGRSKDVIIVGGRNFYPQDMEAAVNGIHPVLQINASAAFMVESPPTPTPSLKGRENEAVVFVQELVRHYKSHDLAQVAYVVRQAIADACDLQVTEVHFVEIGHVPKTSSGKVRRSACRDALVDGTLNPVFSWTYDARHAEIEPSEDGTADSLSAIDRLAGILAGILAVDKSTLRQNATYSELILDSLMAVDLQHAIELEFGVQLNLTRLLSGFSLEQLATEVLAASEEGQTSPQPSPWKGEGAREAGSDPVNPLPMPATTDAGVSFPLSPGQQALWMLHQLQPRSADYNVAGCARVLIADVADRLPDALDKLVARHGALRTTFKRTGPIVRQHIANDIACHLEFVDAGDCSHSEFLDMLRRSADQPFDLSRGPLFRATLFRQGGEQYLLIAMHHIVSDYWSMSLLLKDLISLLTDDAIMPSPPAPLPIFARTSLGREVSRDTGQAKRPSIPEPAWDAGYGDYVNWQQRRLAEPETEDAWRFWCDRLAAPLPALTLPAQKARPRRLTSEGDSVSIILGETATERLRLACGRQGVSTFVFLQAVYFRLLAEVTGQSDLVVGVPSSGRTSARWSNVVGCFVNSVPIRAQVQAGVDFKDFLGTVKTIVSESLSHGELPFPSLVQRLRIPHDPSRNPIFQTMFVHFGASRQVTPELAAFLLPSERPVEIADIFEPVPLGFKSAQFDLTVMTAQIHGCLSILARYNRELYQPEQVMGWLSRYQAILEDVISHGTTNHVTYQ